MLVDHLISILKVVTAQFTALHSELLSVGSRLDQKARHTNPNSPKKIIYLPRKSFEDERENQLLYS